MEQGRLMSFQRMIEHQLIHANQQRMWTILDRFLQRDIVTQAIKLLMPEKSPVPLIEWQQEERTQKEVWTDGSLRDGMAISAVYWSDSSNMNIAFHAKGDQSVTNAEAQAVEAVLMSVPLNNSIIIYCDSEVVVESVKKCHTWSPGQWAKSKIASNLRRIMSLIKLRRDITTDIQHVYAHLLDNDTKERMEIDDAYKDKMTDRLLKMKLKFPGGKWYRILIGNKMADLLTHMPFPRSENEYSMNGLARYELSNLSGHLVLGNKLHIIKQAMYSAGKEVWKKRCPSRSQYILHNDTDQHLTFRIARPQTFALHDYTHFYHKLWSATLPSLHKISLYMKSNRWMVSLKPTVRTRLQNVYSDLNCRSCKNNNIQVEENTDHFISECPTTLKIHTELTKRILEIMEDITKAPSTGPLPTWFQPRPSRYCPTRAPPNCASSNSPKEWVTED